MRISVFDWIAFHWKRTAEEKDFESSQIGRNATISHLHLFRLIASTRHSGPYKKTKRDRPWLVRVNYNSGSKAREMTYLQVAFKSCCPHLIIPLPAVLQVAIPSSGLDSSLVVDIDRESAPYQYEWESVSLTRRPASPIRSSSSSSSNSNSEWRYQIPATQMEYS